MRNITFESNTEELHNRVAFKTRESNGHSVVTMAGNYTNPEWLRNPNA